MTSISRLYEMARTKGEATWAVLDWAAQHGGTFSMKDLWKVYQEAGGGGSIQNFHTTIGSRTAKQHKEGEVDKFGVPYWPPSERKPFTYAYRGSQGGRAHELKWALDKPLRTPPTPQEPLGQVGTPTGDILDKLEDKMGKPALVAAMKRWKSMTDLHRIAADIRATVPARYQMDALQVASEHLIDSGQADQTDMQDAEDEVAPAPEERPTPFRPKAKAPAKAAPPPDDDDDMGPGWRKVDEPETPDSDDGDDEDMGPGWRTIPEPGGEDAETDAGFADTEIPDDFFNDAGGGRDEGGEWPVYLPDPDEDGDKFERAMAQVVDSGKIGDSDPIWAQLKGAKNDVDANRIIKTSKVPKELHQPLIRVAMGIFANTNRDWETGKKIRESRLARLYEVSPLTQNVDFDQKSWLSRIYGMNEADDQRIMGWPDAEGRWPGAGAAWDEMHGGEDAPLSLNAYGSLLFATPQGTEDRYLWSPRDGTWTGIGPMKIMRSGAFLKLMPANGSSSGPILYIPVSKTIPFIDVVGPTPEDLPGFSTSARPNGNVSAQKKAPSGEDIRQAALAVQTYKRAQPPIG